MAGRKINDDLEQNSAYGEGAFWELTAEALALGVGFFLLMNYE